MEFTAPSSGGSGLKPADIEGHLVVVEPQEYIPSMATSYGEKDAIRVRVHDISAQETHEDVLFFGALIGALKSQVGKRVLGVIGKGTAKPGQAPPWVITDASGNADAVKAATAYMTGQVAASMTAPAPAAAAAPVMSDLDAALGNLRQHVPPPGRSPPATNKKEHLIMGQRNVLYRYYDGDGVLLYVGISMSPWQRARQHRDDKPWWDDIRMATFEPYPSRAEALEAERLAIKAEKPRHNIMHNKENGVSRRSFSSERFRFKDRSGSERSGELILVYEVMGDPISDDYNARWDSADDIFTRWLDWYDDAWERAKSRQEARYHKRCVPITWYVMGCQTFESASPQYLSLDGWHTCEWFGDYYARPISSATGQPITSVKDIPVRHKQWKPGFSDKGGFITEATGWKPFALQAWVDLDALTSAQRLRTSGVA